MAITAAQKQSLVAETWRRMGRTNLVPILLTPSQNPDQQGSLPCLPSFGAGLFSSRQGCSW